MEPSRDGNSRGDRGINVNIFMILWERARSKDEEKGEDIFKWTYSPLSSPLQCPESQRCEVRVEGLTFCAEGYLKYQNDPW